MPHDSAPTFVGGRPARVLIIYNEPVLPKEHPDAISEHEILETAEDVEKTLAAGGYEVSRLGVHRDPSVLLNGLKRRKPDVVFNLFEGLADHYDTEAHLAGMLEWLEVPYTGSPYQTLTMARRKHVTKFLLQGAGLPTAPFFVVDSDEVPDNELGWPVIVKPAAQDASLGLDQGSVVLDQQKLVERVAYLIDTYGPPVLVEQFIRGREFNIGVVETPELIVLPPSEILFVDPSPDVWPIVTFDAKWRPESTEYKMTPPKYPAEVAPRLQKKLERLTAEAFRLLGCRDYARVDFRVSETGKPYILEVNPNPDFNPEAGLAGGLLSAGWTHTAFTLELVKQALARGGKPAGAVLTAVTAR
jgi:D-alanine-D-alanine ligase